MSRFRPAFPYSTAAELLVPTYSSAKGVQVKTFPAEGAGIPINVSLKTYGGTESEVNGAYTVRDTATVETWYRPDIKSDCRLRILATGDVFEIVGRPENIELRNQFLKFKVEAVEGGA